MRYLRHLAGVLLGIFFAAHVSAAENLEVGVSRSARLEHGVTDVYELKLDANTFVYAELSQIDFDGKATVFDPTGAIVGVFDYSARGADPVEFDAHVDGTYGLHVTGYQGAFGHYGIQVHKIEPVAKAPERRLTQLLSSYAGDDTPGAVVGVVENGKVTHVQAVGMASLAHEVPFTRHTPSNIASVSKQFTALAIMKLAADGDLSLEDDVREYFPELPDLGHVVTIRDLLRHTSGYREFLTLLYLSGRRVWDGDYIDRSEILRILERQPQLQDKPGSRYNYNNTGYSLATLLLERVTGTSFHKWLADNVFTPLSMNSTRMRTYPGEIIAGAAEGYATAPEVPYRIATDMGGGGGAMIGPGGMYSTVDDLARWIGNLAHGQVGGRELLAEMMRPQIVMPGEDMSYGLGFIVMRYQGLTLIAHDGTDTGYNSILWYFPELDAGIVALSNNVRFRSWSIAYDVADAFFSNHFKAEPDREVTDVDSVSADGSESPVAFSTDAFASLAGHYQVDGYPDEVFVITVDQGGVFVQRPRGEAAPAVLLGPTLLKVTDTMSLKFNVDDEGEVHSFKILDGTGHTAARIEIWQPVANELSGFVGHYYSEELGTVYRVALDDEQLTASQHRLGVMHLTPKTRDTFTTDDLITLKFARRKDGDIEGFMASETRTSNVWFAKQRPMP